jgi:carboxypeptidase T
MKISQLPAALTTLATLAALFATASSSRSSAEQQKQVFSVQLSRSAQVKKKQLAALSEYDILGVSHSQNIVDLRLSGQQFETLNAAGYDISFATHASFSDNDSSSLQEYLSPDQLTEKLTKIASENPDIARLESFGKTTEGLDMWALEITSDIGNAENANRPTVLFNAMHHARELMTTEVVFDIAETLVKEFRENNETKQLLNQIKVLVVPQVNPDGNKLVHGGQSFWRKNAWKYQGNEVGVDLNRNYPAFWKGCNGSSGDRNSDSYRGPSAGSEPETQAMMKLVKSKKPVANISYHSFSELIIFPFGCNRVNNPSRALFEKVAADMNTEVQDDVGRTGTYKVGPAPEVIYAADGTDVDWQWKEAGVVSFAIEVNSRSLGFAPNYTAWRNLTVERQRGAWKSLLNSVQKGLVTVEVPEPKDKTAELIVHRRERGQLVPFDSDRPDFKFTRPVRTQKGRAFVDLFLGAGSFQVSTHKANHE